MASPYPGEEENGDMMKILVATDNHIGFMEKDPVRHNDSLEAFEEVLKIAKEEKVDLILLGGDLFHENKPSRQTLHHTMELFRYYCMGSRPCPIEFRSDPSLNFYHSKFPVVNYEDPNYNVSIPVFSIHGNHDDPVGDGNLSAMDILHVSNFINYFGKIENIEEIELSPLLLQKGETKLALYGLGSCRDERLHRMFRKGNIKFLRPSEEENVWFNILVLHQNRAKHGATNYIPSSFIPDFFDLVIWGHEHECLLEPEFIPTGSVGEDGEDRGLYISQPGSSVATSLCDGEQKPKHCGILYIKNDCTFKLDPVKLRTVRPLILDSVCLSDTGIHPQNNDKVESYLTEKVTELIKKAKRDSSNEKLPLVRLKVDYHGGYSTFSLARFGQKFLDKVANPKNILSWHSRREKQGDRKSEESNDRLTLVSTALSNGSVSDYLHEEVSKEKIELLSNKNMAEALVEFVDKMESDSVKMCVELSLKVSQKLLKEKKVTKDDIETQMKEQRADLFKVQETEGMSAVRELRNIRAGTLADDFDQIQENSSDSDNGTTSIPTVKSARGRGSGRGSRGGTRGGRGGKSQKGSQATSNIRQASKRSLEYIEDSTGPDSPFPAKRNNKTDHIDLTQDSDDDDMQTNASSSHRLIQRSKRRKK